MEFQSNPKNVLAKPESIESKPAEEGNPSASRCWLLLQMAPGLGQGPWEVDRVDYDIVLAN